MNHLPATPPPARPEGNKSIGIDALMRYTGARIGEAMHVGDRFTASGNDSAAREVCSICWVAGPEETAFFMRMLLGDLQAARAARYIE